MLSGGGGPPPNDGTTFERERAYRMIIDFYMLSSAGGCAGGSAPLRRNYVRERESIPNDNYIFICCYHPPGVAPPNDAAGVAPPNDAAMLKTRDKYRMIIIFLFLYIVIIRRQFIPTVKSYGGHLSRPPKPDTP